MNTKVLRKNLVLSFKAADDSKLELTILRPMEGLSGTAVKTAMETILATGAFGDSSQAASIINAQYDIRQVEDITLD